MVPYTPTTPCWLFIYLFKNDKNKNHYKQGLLLSLPWENMARQTFSNFFISYILKMNHFHLTTKQKYKITLGKLMTKLIPNLFFLID